MCSGGGGRAAQEAETAERPADTETRQAERHGIKREIEGDQIPPRQRLAFLLEFWRPPMGGGNVLLATLFLGPLPQGHLLLQLPSSQRSRPRWGWPGTVAWGQGPALSMNQSSWRQLRVYNLGWGLTGGGGFAGGDNGTRQSPGLEQGAQGQELLYQLPRPPPPGSPAWGGSTQDRSCPAALELGGAW